MAGWKGSYYSWYRLRGIGRVPSNFHWGGCGGGGGIGGGEGGGMGRITGVKASGCMVGFT